MLWQERNLLTREDFAEAMTAIQTEEEAKQFKDAFSAEFTFAEQVLGYLTGYVIDDPQRVMTLFKVVHPLAGTVHREPLSFVEIFARGMNCVGDIPQWVPVVMGIPGRLALSRKQVLVAMEHVSAWFYKAATAIGNHPFIEFCGLMNEYIRCCTDALAAGIDFTECSKHSGQHLPMSPHQVAYVNEKLECIFTGRSIVEDQKISTSLPATQTLATAVTTVWKYGQELSKIHDAVHLLHGTDRCDSLAIHTANGHLLRARESLDNALAALLRVEEDASSEEKI